MKTVFESVEEAKASIALMVGVDANSFEEVPDLKVSGMDSLFLNGPDASEELKKSIRDRMNTQKGFKFTKDGQEMRIVIGLFKGGCDRWTIDKSGRAHRI